MNSSSFPNILIIFQIIGIILFSYGCVIFQNSIQRIPERKDFSANVIKQDSYSELRQAYRNHYKLVSDELHSLENLYQKSRERPEWLVLKIENHKQYLEEMAAYPFLCPSHNTTFIVNVEKQCPSCNGKGRGWFGKKCTTCLGKGKITYQSTQNRRCPYCNQYYRGHILGGTLYED